MAGAPKDPKEKVLVSRRRARLPVLAAFCLGAACAAQQETGTIAELERLTPEITEVAVSDSLDKALSGYMRFLEETPTSAKTPEALRRMADLKIEREYGTVVNPEATALPAPTVARIDTADNDIAPDATAVEGESQAAFESRAGAPVELTDAAPRESSGPREAIDTYERILRDYPHYDRSDQVLYQMARAYDELGEVDRAIEVMAELIQRFPASPYVDEASFRRAEYFFVRRAYLDAESAYQRVVARGEASDFYELALYKLGWTFYKQDLYEEALDQYVALLDYKVSTGYDFDGDGEHEDEERRIEDTFRVVSLGFSNLGGPEELSAYFARNGSRTYEDRIYRNLAEFYVDKLRFNDAATVYETFVDANPLHRRSPHFSMRVTEVYAEGGFPQLVVESKKRFARTYALDAVYWQHYEHADMPAVVDYLKSNLRDLAEHYHALYQEEALEDDKPGNYTEALEWYGRFLASFSDDVSAPAVHFQLANLHLEERAFATAAMAFEHTAYGYAAHDQAREAGYAAIYAYREHLKVADADQQDAIKLATADSSLRFADTFPDHEHAASVLGAAADDLYALADYPRAIQAATQLIDVYPESEPDLRRAAWTVVGHGNVELAQFVAAEAAYVEVLTLTPEDDESHAEIVENLAAAVYKQGELAAAEQDFSAAAAHYLRIKALTPTASIRAAAEYDAAVALISMQAWSQAATVLEALRDDHPEHELQSDVTKQLAFVYREAGSLEQSADEYVRVAAGAGEAPLRAEALLVAGELYQEAENTASAIATLRAYVNEFPEPVEQNVETRATIAALLKTQGDVGAHNEALRALVAVDASAGPARTDRTRYLASRAALTLAERTYEHFAGMRLVLPLERSLADKQSRMDVAIAEMDALTAYQVTEVTAAATYYLAEIYLNFSRALMRSERPEGLDASERSAYDLALEEEAYPFEERALDVHQANMALLSAGKHNAWIEKSLGALAELMPGRYAKYETSVGLVPAVDLYAYRPAALEVIAEQEEAPSEIELAEVSSDYQ